MGTPVYQSVNNAAGQNLGATALSTTSITPSGPALVTGNRYFIIQCASNTSAASPSGWALLGTKDSVAGSGAVGAASGLRYITIHYRDRNAGDVWTMPAMALSNATNNSHWIGVVSVAPSTPDFVLDTPTIIGPSGTFNTSTTTYLDNIASFATTSGALLIAGSCMNDNVTVSSPGISQSGATFGSVVERADGGTATGNDVSGRIHTIPVTTGATATLTFGSVLSAASQGETAIIQQTETAAAAGAAISTLTDEFATLGAWATVVNFATSSNTAAAASTTAAATLQTSTAAPYDMTNGTLTWKQVDSSVSGIFNITGTIQNTAGTQGWGFKFTASNTVQAVVSNATAGSTRTHTNGDWYRIRHVSSGTPTLYYEYSADGVSWTQLHSTTTMPTRIDRMVVRFDQTANVSNTAHNQIAHINLPPGPLFLTVTDDFSGTLSKWEGSPTNFSIVSGALKLTTNNTDGLIGMGPNSIVGSAVYWQQTNLTLTGDDYMKAAVYDWDSGSGGWGFYFTASAVQPLINNTPTGPTRTHANGDFYRIREASGTIYYEYTTDPNVSWTQLHSAAAAPPRPDRMEFTFFVNHQTGTSAATIDNFNITPPPVAVGLVGDLVEDWDTGYSYGPGDAPEENPVWATGILVGPTFISIETASSINTLFGSTVATTGQALILEADGSIGPGNAVQTPANYYEFTDTAIFCEMHATTSTFTVTNIFSTGQYAIFQLGAYGGGAVSFGILDSGGGVILFTGGDLDPQPAYDPVAHKFLRFRETSGTIYWETSPDRSTWTVIDSTSTSGAFPGGGALLMQPYWGLWDFDGAAGDIFMMVDNINVAGGATGTIASTAKKVTFAGTAAQTQSGAIASALQKSTSALAGEQIQTGTAAATVQKVVAALSGSSLDAPTGTIVASLRALSTNLVGAQTQTGTAAAFLQHATASLTGAQEQAGTVASALQILQASLQGVEQPSGTIASAVQYLQASLLGAQTQSGTITVTLQHAVAALLGDQLQTGTIAAVLQHLSASLAGSLEPTGTISVALQKLVMTASAEQAQTGTIASTLQKLTAALEGAMAPSGTATLTLQHVQAALTAAQEQSGSVASTLQKLTAALTAEQIQSGALAATLQHLSIAMSGSQVYTGTLAAAIQLLAFAATGGQEQSGAIAVQLRQLTADLQGSMPPSGTIATALQHFTMTASGEQAQSGAIAVEVQHLVADLQGAMAPTGEIATMLQRLQMTATAEHVQSGAIAVELQKLTTAMQGVMPPSGELAATLQRLTMLAAGDLSSDSTIAATLQHPLASLSGFMAPTGTIAAAIQHLTMIATAEQSQSGAIASALQPMTFTASGLQIVSGELTAAIQHLTFAAAGAQTQSGAIASALQPMTFTASGLQIVSGTLTAQLQHLTAALQGVMPASGEIASTLQPLAFAGLGAQIYSSAIASIMAPPVASLSGAMDPTGEIAAILSAPLFSGIAIPVYTGSIAAIIGPSAGAFSGALEPSGELASVMQPMLLTASGSQLFTGTITTAIHPLTAAVIGSMAPSGDVASTLFPPVFTGAGAYAPPLVSGALSASLPVLVFDAAGSQANLGLLAATLAAPTFFASGDQLLSGAIEAALRAPTAQLLGREGAFGGLSAQLATMTFTATGLVISFISTPWPDRTFIVRFEQRTLQIRGESRLVMVPVESRTVVIKAEPRTMGVPGESRTQVVR